MRTVREPARRYPDSMPLTSACQVIGTDNPVHGHRGNIERQGMLETAHRTIRLRSEDSIYLEPLAYVRCTTAHLASGQSHISAGAALKGCRSRQTIPALHAEEITLCENRRIKASLGIMPLAL
jgi:hypothetical protein